ncbi:carbohydrate ABC transporter permease [Vallitalea sp.]|uniref:carbohydrate ABC transporter permease n=1 Tax=Vallitalea sp. TaxID=1882829 RepID=UPI0025D78D2A|nr:carbohydrate ABC transporter permease [Vallitalea sp.]MCT4687720.1 carbohydrate ABC transporter permease [Vallitalea sp.]
MVRKKRKESFHNISRKSNIIITIFFGLFSLMCIVPFITVIMSSITDETVLRVNGYSLFPAKFNFAAYEYIFKAGTQIIKSFGVSVFITVIGTVVSVTVTAFYAYALSRKCFGYKNFFNYMAFFTMLFGGGLVPTYLVLTRIVKLQNTIWALILPLTLNAFYVIVMRTFFRTSIPDSIIEASQIDGAGEFRTFFKIILPISLPSVATIALFTTLGYWNDWFNALLYIDVAQITPIQYLLMKIEKQTEFLIQNANEMGISRQEVNKLPSETLRMAIVVISTIPIACAYPFFQKYFIQGLTVGSVKG